MRRKFFPALRAESSELLHLDLLRLIAAYAIIIEHFWHNLDLDPATEARWLRLDELSAFVDVFFVLSGIVIAWIYSGGMTSWADYGQFLQKRAARLLPLHWATLAFYVAVGLVGASLGETLAEGRYDGSCLLQNALIVHASGVCSTTSYNDVSWSISAELFMYLLFPLFVFIQARSRAILFVVAVGILAALFLFDWVVQPMKLWPDRTFDGGVVRALPAFLIGMSAYSYRHRLARFGHWGPVWIAAFFVCVGGVLADAPKLIIVASAYLMAVAAFGCDMKGSASALVRRLAPGGQLTYSLYMLHPVVGIVFIKVLGLRILGVSGGLQAVFVILALPVSATVAYLSLIWFEAPARRWLSQLRFGGRVNVPAE